MNQEKPKYKIESGSAKITMTAEELEAWLIDIAKKAKTHNLKP